MYDQGKGVTQDYKEAVEWYPKAAEQGDANGQDLWAYVQTKVKGSPRTTGKQPSGI